MSHWYCINLGDAMVAAGELADLQQQLEHEYRERGCPADMALYVQHVSTGSLHCEVLVYFTPTACAVAREAGAEPCAAPAMDVLGLVAGGPS